jgi:hypothetical protein
MRRALQISLMTGLITTALFLYRCDVYKSENKEWENKVVIYFKNLTVCPVLYYLDGSEKDQIEPGLDYTAEDVGQGVHFLEAYPWDDTQFSCSFVYTPELKNKDRYEWILDSSTACNICNPTPTSAPTSTPTPEPTTAGTASPTSTPAP